ncbi:Mevalonate kinase [Eumeta japonica]|uniref:Mevalonate kinase n=1 Tax=Eumeta variegata TaxID=151549 RepID=A0A4C1TCK4_EUMVA|nr:Mevalonate kinase [Eumeta japonica]
MLKFQVKSPGKIILHGEHAVVYQKPALAAVVGLGTTLQFTAAENGKRVVTLQLEALNTNFEIQVDLFNKFLKQCRSKFPQEKFESSAQLLEEREPYSSPKQELELTQAFTINIDTELNLGAGLGAGGYVIVLLPENYASNEVYWKLKEELEAAGFGVFATTAGGAGLRMEQI